MDSLSTLGRAFFRPMMVSNLLDLLDRTISFQRCFVTITGSINAALLLSQSLYWDKRTEDPDGWFYKSRDLWHDETGLTHEQQETARKRLREKGFIEEKEDRLNHRVWFRINENAICKALQEIPVSPNRERRRGSAGKGGAGTPSITVPSKQAEITAEITLQKTPKPPEASPSASLFPDEIQSSIKSKMQIMPESPEKKSLLPTSEPAKAIASLFNRRLTTEWSEKEFRAYKAIKKISMTDLAIIEGYYSFERTKKKNYLRRDLLTFLNNYNGELDRANAWNDKPKAQEKQDKPIF